MKKTISLLLALLMCASLAAPVLADEPSGISVTVGGNAVVWTDAKPFIDANNRTMVPLRAVADAMGLRVVWYAADREAAFTNGSKVIYFPIDSSTAYASDGSSVQMDTTAVIASDRTYAPIRYLAEFFGYEVGWDGSTSTVTITMGNQEGFVCGETEPHNWKAANYQAPETCTVCGATQGSALTPDFVTYGINLDLAVGVRSEYRTTCNYEPDIATFGDLTVLDYNVIKSDDTHEAKDGYEWRVATVQMLFSDENAQQYGYMFPSSQENYYDIVLNDETIAYNEEGDSATFTVNYYGEDVECVFRREVLTNEWVDDIANATLRVSYQVPVGYDGCVYGQFDYAVEWPDGAHINDIYDASAFHYFRFA